jgi:hypothetical protein
MSLVASNKIKLVRKSVDTLDLLPELPHGHPGPDSIEARMRLYAHDHDYLYIDDDDTDFRFANTSRWMYIRPVYKEIFTSIMKLDDHMKTCKAGGLCWPCKCVGRQISGCQGIGKSFWIYYFVYRIISAGGNVSVLNMLGQKRVPLPNGRMFAEHITSPDQPRWFVCDSISAETLENEFFTDFHSLDRTGFMNYRTIYVTSDPIYGVSLLNYSIEHYMMSPASLPECVAAGACPLLIGGETYIVPPSAILICFAAFNGIFRLILEQSTIIQHDILVPSLSPHARFLEHDDETLCIPLHPRDTRVHKSVWNCGLSLLYQSRLVGSAPTFPSPRPLTPEQLCSAQYAFKINLIQFIETDGSLSSDIPSSCLNVLYSTLGLPDVTITDAFQNFALPVLSEPFRNVKSSAMSLELPPADRDAAHMSANEQSISGLLSYPTLESAVSPLFVDGSHIHLPYAFSSRYVCGYERDFVRYKTRIMDRPQPRRFIHSPMLRDLLRAPFLSKVLAKLSVYDASTYGSLFE